jgi:PAS domain-containing protein
LLEAAPDAMVIVNQAGEIVLLNLQAERQFGYHRSELIGQQVKNIIPEGFAERLIADGTRSAASGFGRNHALRIAAVRMPSPLTTVHPLLWNKTPGTPESPAHTIRGRSLLEGEL